MGFLHGETPDCRTNRVTPTTGSENPRVHFPRHPWKSLNRQLEALSACRQILSEGPLLLDNYNWIIYGNVMLELVAFISSDIKLVSNKATVTYI